MRRPAPLALLAAAVLASGCGAVSVTPSGSGIKPAARAAGCAIEFLRTKAPERAYDEIGAIHWQGTWAGAATAQEAMQAKACELGADAVIVNRDFVPNTSNATGIMTGTAIKYR